MSRRNTLLVAARFLLPILWTSVTGLFATEPIAAFEQGVQCPACVDEYSAADRARFRERERQIALARARGEG